jgi:hypothetical protein
VDDCIEHGNEPSGSIKDVEFLEQLRDCQLPKNEFVPWMVQAINECFILINRETDAFGCAVHPPLSYTTTNTIVSFHTSQPIRLRRLISNYKPYL